MSTFRPSRRTTLTGGAAAVLAGAATPAHGAAVGERGWVTSTLRRMSLEEKIGQLFVQHVYGSRAETPDERNLPLYGVSTPAEVVRKYHLGGICYFAWTDSVEDPDQITALSNGLQRAALTGRRGPRVPLTISVDQEQGVVTRIGPPATQLPGSMALGAGRSAEDARQAAMITGRELRAMGISMDFAPVCDVNVNPRNPVIGTRSFSSDPTLVSTLVSAQVDGYQRDGRIASCAKHFPGHGDTDTDSHTGFPVITHSRSQWARLDAPPFIAAIRGGIDMIMTAHLSMPALDDSGDPATLSRPVVTGLLREELGFEGVVITDSLRMEGVREKYGDGEIAVRALTAGVDQLLMTPAMDDAVAAVREAVLDGRIPRRSLDAKVRRVLTAKYRRGLVGRPFADPAEIDSVVGTPRHRTLADAVTERTTTLVKDDAAAVPLRPDGSRVLLTGYGTDTLAALSTAVSAAGARTSTTVTGSAPSDDEIDAVVAAAQQADTVVVTTMKAGDVRVDEHGGQAKLVRALLETDATVIVLAVRDPYDIAHFPQAPTYLATYSDGAVAMAAAGRVLLGEVSPQGTLPVDIPTADDPETLLYPFGHGLTG
ncbi:glycoside hydrolase family 3 protein [Janibacter sp. GS2]|uniref:glycoside hydrolase family 3 protein n=1 Tax=Janibacter sp. GS2 TaxID=3442646 RepID=UPI003EBE8D5B